MPTFSRASRGRHALKNVESAKTHCVCFVGDATNGTSQDLRRHDIVQRWMAAVIMDIPCWRDVGAC